MGTSAAVDGRRVLEGDPLGSGKCSCCEYI